MPPTYALYTIEKYLGFIDLLHSALVCQDWYEILHNELRLFDTCNRYLSRRDAAKIMMKCTTGVTYGIHGRADIYKRGNNIVKNVMYRIRRLYLHDGVMYNIVKKDNNIYYIYYCIDHHLRMKVHITYDYTWFTSTDPLFFASLKMNLVP